MSTPSSRSRRRPSPARPSARRSAVRLLPYPARRPATGPSGRPLPPGPPPRPASGRPGRPKTRPHARPCGQPRTQQATRQDTQQATRSKARSDPWSKAHQRARAGIGADARPPQDGDLTTATEVIIRLTFEVLAGQRPLRQLAPWATPRVYEELAWHRRSSIPAAERVCTPRILTLWSQRLATDRAETGAVADTGSRIQAVALRLERFRNRWRCRALETTVPGD